MRNIFNTVYNTIKNWMYDPFFYDVYEALRCPDPTEINRIYYREF